MHSLFLGVILPDYGIQMDEQFMLIPAHREKTVSQYISLLILWNPSGVLEFN